MRMFEATSQEGCLSIRKEREERERNRGKERKGKNRQKNEKGKNEGWIEDMMKEKTKTENVNDTGGSKDRNDKEKL